MFYVRDLSRSLEFYRCHFGARVEHDEPGLFVQLLIRQHSLRLVHHPDAREINQEGRELQVDVPDLDYFIKSLGSTSTPHRKLLGPRGVSQLVLNDPDSNTVVLTEVPIERPSRK